MNKLAPIALALLLSFGAALWYLANVSLNDHVKARIVQVGQYYSGLSVTVKQSNLQLASGLGTITGFSIGNVFAAEKITFSFSPAYIKNGIVTLDQINIYQSVLTVEKENDNKANNVFLLLNNINDKIAQIHDARKQKDEPYIQVKNVVVHNATLIKAGKTVTVKTLPLGAIGGKNGLPESLFGTEVIRKTIKKLYSYDNNAHPQKMPDTI